MIYLSIRLSSDFQAPKMTNFEYKPISLKQPAFRTTQRKNSERRLSGKVVDEDTRGALERSDQMTPEQLLLIDAILTLPETTFERECQRRIAAINAVIVYYGVEEGQPCSRGPRGRHVKVPPAIQATDFAQSAPDTPLSWAISSIKKDKRPTICFLCLGNPALPIRKRVVLYVTLGSLSRHLIGST
jgi:hypothetical protein